jgi:hypothetical protein
MSIFYGADVGFIRWRFQGEFLAAEIAAESADDEGRHGKAKAVAPE